VLNRALDAFLRRVAILLTFVLVAGLCAVPAAAGTTGNISGTITVAGTGAPAANISVTAVSPSGRESAKTDAKGFFSITGLATDTYTVSLQGPGFEPVAVQGVNVFPDQTVSLQQSMSKSLTTIGRVTSRPISSAYQPTQTTDTYTVNTAQIKNNLGKNNNTSESSLVASLPGASFDSSGYPVLRGGRENEEGFQFEGISYTDAFTTQFTNSLRLNGVSTLQVTPGAGDASSGNSGTGTINLTAKIGSRPPFGSMDLETNVYPYFHQLSSEYGFATPDGKLSNYVSYTGSREDRVFGARGSDQTQIGGFFATQNVTGNDIINNFIYRFGKDQQQKFQFFYQNVNVRFFRHGSAEDGLFYKTNDPYSLSLFTGRTGLNTAQVQSIIPLDPQQGGVFDPARNAVSYQPDETIKFQYSNNLNSSTFLTAKYYDVASSVNFNYVQTGQGAGGFSDRVSLQGGNRAGVAVDLTKQLNSTNLLQLGAVNEILHPIFDYQSNDTGFYSVALFGNGFEAADFLPQAFGPCAVAAPKGSFYSTAKTCGYLSQYFPGGTPRIPLYYQITPVNEYTTAGYIKDTYSPNSNLKIDIGLRLDASHASYPGTFDKAATNPAILEPRFGFAYQLSKNDAFRASYGRTIEIAPLADMENPINRRSFDAFVNIPSYNNSTLKVATYCGPQSTTTCANYADQLYWEYQNGAAGVPYTPIKPETFNNFDASYSHQFKHNVALKLTPFYRRGYDAAALVANLRTDPSGNFILGPTGVPLQLPAVATNLGVNRTTGVEFLLTKDAAYGLSGQIAATYINEFSNVIPLSGSEDFFPSIPQASLVLGNQYRVGFLSPFNVVAAVAYKTRSGFRISPIVSYNHGYPIGAGLNTATFVNGKAYGVTNTNVTSPTGSTGATQYVDPANPGSIFHPNVAATRGTPESSSAGGVLSNSRLTTNLTLEYSPPQNTRATFGLLINNLFNNLYGVPGLNGRYQPIATGIAGPLSGQSNQPINFPTTGFFQYNAAQFGQQPYRIIPSNVPLTYRFYYQLQF
jgi:hypothetical protein